MFSHTSKRDYVDFGGSVRYLDGSPLARSSKLPKPAYAVMALLVLVAAAAGGLFLYHTLDNVLNAPMRAKQTVQDNIARSVAYDLPVLSTLMAADDATIKQSFTDAGYTIYDTTSAEEYPDGGFELVKLPADVSIEEAGLMYVQGVNKLSAVDASRLMKGSWTMTVNRTGYVDMRVRYADFQSGSIEAAIQAAMVSEGLDVSVLGEAGTDEAGNTYQAGNVDVGGTIYSWRVSAIALSSVYSISGLPDTAVFVGIRMTQ